MSWKPIETKIGRRRALAETAGMNLRRVQSSNGTDQAVPAVAVESVSTTDKGRNE